MTDRKTRQYCSDQGFLVEHFGSSSLCHLSRLFVLDENIATNQIAEMEIIRFLSNWGFGQEFYRFENQKLQNRLEMCEKGPNFAHV
jgi:hypothetical protein